MNTTKLTLIVSVLGSLIISCQKPHLIDRGVPEISPLYTEGYNYQRQNYFNVSVNLPLTVTDEITLGGLPTQSVCLISDHLVFSTYNGFLYMFDIHDLDDNPDTRISRGMTGSPTFSGKYIYLPSEEGQFGLLAYNIYSGKIDWALQAYYSAGSPVIIDKRLYHTALNGSVMCLNAANGEIVWETNIAGRINSSPAYAGEHLVTVSESGIVRCFEPSSGSILWNIELGETVHTQPMISRNLVFIVTYPGKVYVLDINSGRVIRREIFEVNLFTPLASDKNILLIPGSNGILNAYELQGFDIRWSAELEGPFSVAPLITRDYVFIGTAQRQFYILDKNNGKILQQFKMEGRPRSLPIIHENQLFLGSEYRTITVFSTVNENDDEQAIKTE